MKALDSTFIIDFLRGDIPATKKAKELENETFATTYINYFEVILGEVSKHATNDTHVMKAIELFSRIEVFELNKTAAMNAAHIGATLNKKGIKINSHEILIAGTLLSKGITTIITRDKDFKKIEGLKTETY